MHKYTYMYICSYIYIFNYHILHHIALNINMTKIMKILLGIISILICFVLLIYIPSHTQDKSHGITFSMRYQTKHKETDTKNLSSRLIKILNDFSVFKLQCFSCSTYQTFNK